MTRLRYPSLFQINTRVRLSELSAALGRRATLDDLPDSDLDRLAGSGFDWVWLLGVWQTGPAGRQVSLSNGEWQREFRELLPDLQEADICWPRGSTSTYREGLSRLRGDPGGLMDSRGTRLRD